MNRSINYVIVASAVLLTTQAALAQMAGMTPPPPSTGPASEALAAYNRVKPNVLKAADKMPEDGYQFKPTPDIRAYARIVNHVTEAQFRTCSALSGEKMDPKSVPSDTADKATIVAALKASFAECDKAYAGLTDATIAEMLQLGPAKRSRIGLAWGNISHDNEQYAELATYLRLKGLVPPSSEK
jgi:hypothetical protein